MALSLSLFLSSFLFLFLCVFPRSTSFEGTNVIQPFSVSAQQSDDKKTIVVRLVNHASEEYDASVSMGGGWRAASASAVTLASDDLNAENTAANVDNVAPHPLDGVSVGSTGVVQVKLPSHSYTVVSVTGA